MSRPRPRLRDAALVYASRGIPVLPLHHPLPDLGRRTIPDGEAIAPAWSTGCSCRDRACAQVGKHPLGSLVPHGLKDATINRARILAWWTRYPQANIGLATGHRFDVLDVDGPAGGEAIRTFATEHGLTSSGPLVRTGGGGWHYYVAPTGLGNVRPRDLEHVDWRGRGGYVVAPPSRHASGHLYRFLPGRDLELPIPEVPAPLRQRLQPRQLDRPLAPDIPLPAPHGAQGRYVQAALAEELARVAAAPKGQRNRQLWESGRNLYNLVATGALDPDQVHQELLVAADHCGLLAEEPRQTHRTLASARQVGLGHPRRPPQRPTPDRTTSDASPAPPRWAGGEQTRESR
jgi:hypothetical protein